MPRPVKDTACEVMFSRTMFLGRFGFDRKPVFAQVGYAGHASPFVLRGCATRSPKGEAWWSQTGSNRRPHACKARALPAELWPQFLRRPACRDGQPVFAQAGYAGHASPFVLRSCATRSRRRSVVGLGRLELPTSRLSSARSNQLSYKPLTLSLSEKDQGTGSRANQRFERRMQSHKRVSPGACSSAKKEKRRRRNPANGAQQS